ncbi:MAG: hypothetical protein F6J90_28985 [Moorea sp. SIOASIH]|nr:hypothetical protein [Moorena sp. SIOASIH]
MGASPKSCLTRWVERASCPWCGTGILPVVWNGHLARGVERASCPWCGTGILPVVWNGQQQNPGYEAENEGSP